MPSPALYNDDQPIAALATSSGSISIVRVSGKRALEVGDRLVGKGVKKPSERPSGTFFHTTIYDPFSHKPVDDVLMLISRAPNSYTGEDTLEIQGHGGRITSFLLLEATMAAGARDAEAGEFTRRAFLNGKLDLTQAEAICDLIGSETERAARVALSQLRGSLGNRIRALYEVVTTCCASLEYLLDFSEDEIPPGYIEQQETVLCQSENQIEKMVKSCRQGMMLRGGALIVLSGKPNVGKSSLMNALLGRDRAIVHHEPGTTRDTIEEQIELAGVPIRLADTAGLRKSDNPVELAGIERTEDLMLLAHLHLRLIDGTQPYNSADFKPGYITGRVIYVITKSDLEQHQSWQAVAENSIADSLAVSNTTGAGLELLKDLIIAKLDLKESSDEPPLVSWRHEQELRKAGDQVRHARFILLSRPEQLVLAANHLRSAAEALGRITGRVYSDDLLDTLFSNFCVGK